jgi:hypothetical protein
MDLLRSLKEIASVNWLSLALFALCVDELVAKA